MKIQLTKYALSISLPIFLVISLIYFSNISFGEFSAALTSISLPEAFAILTCTAAFVFLSSIKWRMVMRRIGQESPHLDGWGPYIYYTSLGAALSIVMTAHFSVTVARAFGTRLHLKQSPVVGAGASVYEQLFDLGVILLFVLPGAFALILGTGAWGWTLAAAGALAATAIVIPVLMRRSRRWLLNVSLVLARYFKRFEAAADFFAKDQSSTLFEPTFVMQVLAISVVRYLVLMLQAFLVLWAAEIPIAAGDLLNAFPVAQASQIIAITPGNLGISEWTWSGVLTWAGYPASVVVQFVLVNRVVSSLCLTACFFCVAPFGATHRKYRTSGQRQ